MHSVNASVGGRGSLPRRNIWRDTGDTVTHINTGPGVPMPKNWLDSFCYTFISLKEVFYILPCNSIPLAPHPAKKEKNIQSKQFLKTRFSSPSK